MSPPLSIGVIMALLIEQQGNFWICRAGYQGRSARTDQVTVTGAPAESGDDAREVAGVGDINDSSLTVNGATSPVGVRFILSETIPQGSTILSATVTLISNENDSASFTMRYAGELTGTPGIYTTGALDITGRNYTTATVDEVDPVFVLDTPFVCQDISEIVQEIVDAEDLVNFAMTFTEVSGGTRSFYAFDNGSAQDPASITIVYQP